MTVRELKNIIADMPDDDTVSISFRVRGFARASTAHFDIESVDNGWPGIILNAVADPIPREEEPT